MSNKLIIILVLLVGLTYSSALLRCGPNEIFDTCGTACPLTCKNPVPPIACPAICIIACRCKDGYLLKDNGDCVLPEDC